uniref:Uncharacterized protein n=1 Tax=viral metagenome TaxID=1070528 RepID=A0A6C0KS33_9ZZZZ
MSTQLSSPATYDVANMIFGKAIAGSAGAANGNGPAIKYFRIPISTRNSDGTIGELVFQTEELFSFGVSRNTDQATGKVTGYTFPLCMWNKDGASDPERAFSSLIEQVVEKCKDHLVLDSTKVEIKKFNLKRDVLDSLGNFMYWKRGDDGQILQDKGPVLYPKLIESKKNNKIITGMFDSNGNDIEPLSLEKKFCWVKAAIKIESIYVGSKISLQVKVYEAEVRLVESGARRLLQRPRSDARVTVARNEAASAAPVVSSAINDEADEDDEPIRDDEDEEMSIPTKAPTPPPTVESTPARKVVRKVIPKK